MATQICLRVTEQDHRRYMLAAQLSKIEMSSYLRECCERLVAQVEDKLPPQVCLEDLVAIDVLTDEMLD